MSNASRTASLPLAVPTALHDDATLDPDGQSLLAAAVADAGADAVGILHLGAGEVDELDDDERVAVLRATRRASGGLPVLAGVGAPGPDQLGTARRLADAGADVLVVPLGGAADRRTVVLGQIAELGLPLVLHHHPGATGAAIATADLAVLTDEFDAALVHEAVPVSDAVSDLTAGGGSILGGLGGLFLPEELDAGAVGTAAASAAPGHLADIVRRHLAGDAGAAREHHLLACGYLRLEAGSSGTVVRKEAWRQRGVLASGRARRGHPLGAATKTAITRRLGELGIELRAPWPAA